METEQIKTHEVPVTTSMGKASYDDPRKLLENCLGFNVIQAGVCVAIVEHKKERSQKCREKADLDIKISENSARIIAENCGKALLCAKKVHEGLIKLGFCKPGTKPHATGGALSHKLDLPTVKLHGTVYYDLTAIGLSPEDRAQRQEQLNAALPYLLEAMAPKKVKTEENHVQ